MTTTCNEIVKIGPLAYFVLTIWHGMLDARPTSQKALEAASGLSPYKTKTAIARLQATGYVSEAGGGVWQLTDNIRQLEMFSSSGREIEPVIDGQFSDSDEIVDEAEAVEVDEKNFFSPDTVVVVKDSSLSNLKLESLTTTTKEKFFSSVKSVKLLLESSVSLFGEKPFGKPGSYLGKPLLSWIAQAYDQRLNLRHPARVIYTNCKSEQNPEAKYLERPWDYLPNEFLRSVGLAEHIKPEPQPLPESEPEPEPWEGRGIDESVMATETMSAASAWGSAKEQLRFEMPKAAFETWVEDVKLLSFEKEEFVIGVLNSYARDWLDSRLTSTLNRLLTGICNRRVSVRFVEGNQNVVL